jgi:serine/threonine-protein kinase HipA
MLISGSNNLSQLRICLETAHNFLLSRDDARIIFTKQTEIIEKNWNTVCDETQLSEIDRKLFWKRRFLNPFTVE